MNERIKELLIEADIYECDDFEPHPTFEKFAELIVQECSGFVYNYPEKYLTRNQAREISLNMEKHFGVES